MARPRAARRAAEPKHIGEYVKVGELFENGTAKPGESEAQGVVVYAAGIVQMELSNGTKLNGDAVIIKNTFATGGNKFSVLIGGKYAADGNGLSQFATLAEAAEFLGV